VQVCRYRRGVRRNWRLRGAASDEDFDALFRAGYTAQVADVVIACFACMMQINTRRESFVGGTWWGRRGVVREKGGTW
jgi:hypothetical protein